MEINKIECLTLKFEVNINNLSLSDCLGSCESLNKLHIHSEICNPVIFQVLDFSEIKSLKLQIHENAILEAINLINYCNNLEALSLEIPYYSIIFQLSDNVYQKLTKLRFSIKDTTDIFSLKFRIMDERIIGNYEENKFTILNIPLLKKLELVFHKQEQMDKISVYDIIKKYENLERLFISPDINISTIDCLINKDEILSYLRTNKRYIQYNHLYLGYLQNYPVLELNSIYSTTLSNYLSIHQHDFYYTKLDSNLIIIKSKYSKQEKKVSLITKEIINDSKLINSMLPDLVTNIFLQHLHNCFNVITMKISNNEDSKLFAQLLLINDP